MGNEWKDKISNGVTKGKEKLNTFKNMSQEERKEKVSEYIKLSKKKAKEFMDNVRNFKKLSKQEKKKTGVILAGGILVVCLILSIFVAGGSGTNSSSGPGKGGRGLSAEQKIELAKNLPLNYFTAEDLLSSGGLTYVMWTANEDSVKATRDNITFEFVVTSSGEAYLSNVRNNGETLSEPAIEAVLDSYYDIGVAAGTLR